MSLEANKSTIVNGKAVLGIELGSTRIKAVLVNEKNQPIASGSHEWENQLVNNIWTYSEEAIWTGIQERCKGKIWCSGEKTCSHWIQRDDAWLYAF